MAATTSAEPEYRVDLSDITGLGAEEYPGFLADVCPEVVPDLSRYRNLLADALKRDAALYEAHRTGRTKSGAKCIKMGLDNPGHPMIKAVDMCAGDEVSYVTFAAVHQGGPACVLRGVHHGAGEAKPGRRSLHHGRVARGAGRGRAHGSRRCASASSSASISQARRGWRCATPT